MEDVSFFFVSKIEITRRTYIPSNHRRRSPWAKAWDTTTYMYSAGLVKKTLSTCGVAASAYRALVLSAIARPIPPSPTLTSSATTRASIESAAKRGRKVFRHPSVRPSALQIGNLRGVRALEWGEIPCFFRLMGTQADRQCMPRRPRQSPWHADAVASEALL